MNTKAILGASLAAIFVATMTMSPIFATHGDVDPGYLGITSASQTGTTFEMTLEDDVKQIPAKKAGDVVTFWAWKIPNTGDEALRVAAITIHHGVNDHQIGVERSTPVQSFHPHIAQFDGAFCLVGISSPAADFRVKDNTITLDLDETYDGFAATGTIGPRGDCEATGLGITSVADTA